MTQVSGVARLPPVLRLGRAALRVLPLGTPSRRSHPLRALRRADSRGAPRSRPGARSSPPLQPHAPRDTTVVAPSPLIGVPARRPSGLARLHEPGPSSRAVWHEPSAHVHAGAAPHEKRPTNDVSPRPKPTRERAKTQVHGAS